MNSLVSCDCYTYKGYVTLCQGSKEKLLLCCAQKPVQVQYKAWKCCESSFWWLKVMEQKYLCFARFLQMLQSLCMETFHASRGVWTPLIHTRHATSLLNRLHHWLNNVVATLMWISSPPLHIRFFLRCYSLFYHLTSSMQSGYKMSITKFTLFWKIVHS